VSRGESSSVDWEASRLAGGFVMRGSVTRAEAIDQAIEHLRSARELLTRAEAPRTLARVRLAISSAKGARRHAGHDDIRAERRKGGR